MSKVFILSATWGRDHQSAAQRLRHGAFIWSHTQQGWGYRGKSNIFPIFSVFQPTESIIEYLKGYREGFYLFDSTMRKYSDRQAPVQFQVTKSNLGNSCIGHAKMLTVQYYCKKGNQVNLKSATAKQNQTIVLSCM